MYRKSARERRGKGEERGTDTSTTDKLDILLPIRIQIDEGLRSVWIEWIVDFSFKHVCEIMKKEAKK